MTMLAAALVTMTAAALDATAKPASTAREWTCRNADFEITCGEGKCGAAASFTPMSVSLSATGKLAVCAYSGCWEGRGKIVRHGNFRVFIGTRLAWSNPSGGPGAADFAVVLDTSDKVAVLKGAGYAHPMTCE
jgi:uncharacterized low-complexity protein